MMEVVVVEALVVDVVVYTPEVRGSNVTGQWSDSNEGRGRRMQNLMHYRPLPVAEPKRMCGGFSETRMWARIMTHSSAVNGCFWGLLFSISTPLETEHRPGVMKATTSMSLLHQYCFTIKTKPVKNIGNPSHSSHLFKKEDETHTHAVAFQPFPLSNRLT